MGSRKPYKLQCNCYPAALTSRLITSRRWTGLASGFSTLLRIRARFRLVKFCRTVSKCFSENSCFFIVFAKIEPRRHSHSVVVPWSHVHCAVAPLFHRLAFQFHAITSRHLHLHRSSSSLPLFPIPSLSAAFECMLELPRAGEGFPPAEVIK